MICINDADPYEELLCNTTRYDQRDENEFKSFAYKKDKPLDNQQFTAKKQS